MDILLLDDEVQCFLVAPLVFLQVGGDWCAFRVREVIAGVTSVNGSSVSMKSISRVLISVNFFSNILRHFLGIADIASITSL